MAAALSSAPLPVEAASLDRASSRACTRLGRPYLRGDPRAPTALQGTPGRQGDEQSGTSPSWRRTAHRRSGRRAARACPTERAQAVARPKHLVPVFDVRSERGFLRLCFDLKRQLPCVAHDGAINLARAPSWHPAGEFNGDSPSDPHCHVFAQPVPPPLAAPPASCP
jgi:hypothetical protein